MDRSDTPLSEQATAILRLIADGRSYDQILMRRPELTYQDIFAAAQEALAKLYPGQADAHARLPAPPTQMLPEDAGPPDDAPPGQFPASPLAPTLVPDEAPAQRLSFIDRARQTHHRAFTRWTPEEDDQLERLFRCGAHLAEIGQALGRHNGAIRSRLAKLGLLPEGIDDPDQLLPQGGWRASAAEAPEPPATSAPAPTATPPSPPRSSFGWDTIRRRLERAQERE